MTDCNLCPRKCGVNRTLQKDFCGTGNKLMLAKAMLHKWEEPCISVKNGAGAVFFSGCNLHCCYCQNNSISNLTYGIEVSVEKLADIFLMLQRKGADNIELVTPTHFVPLIIKSLDLVKPQLKIPVIYNTSGYELPETIRSLKGHVDVYLPDLKYFSPEASARYSNADDYFKFASESILEMVSQTGKPVFGRDGAIIRGTIIRHLVLSTLRHDSMKIMKWISENIPLDSVIVSVMCQYTPLDFIPDKYSEIKRRVTKMEYNSVVNYSAELGLKGFCQQQNSSSEKYVPDFDLSGILNGDAF
ncbi:MAG: radical SAM protein [Ruminococcus sp.]|nr:radical SAM protein [Ruminococcus sp.]